MAPKTDHLSDKITRLIRELEQSGYMAAITARSLVDIGKPAVQPLVDILENEDAWIQKRASKLFLNDHKKQESITLSDQLELEYIYWRMRGKITVILGDIGDPLATGPLIKIALSKSSGEDIRCSAIESLGKIKDPAAIEPLIELLNSYDENLKVKFEAVEALGKFENQRAIDGLIKAAVTTRVPQFRDRIMKTITRASPLTYFLPICSCLITGSADLEEEMLQEMLELLAKPLKREFTPFPDEPALQACLVKLKPFFLSVLLAGSPDIRILAKILLQRINGIEKTSDS